ncbi:unnamed protein product [Caenorhabditis auriculariae]|uniref:Uncharacterized protein n=1 Tax=Caenorhabditis auriculariae TaxID=2777116 RepID=A0A8S1HKE2_9PELO|nr:unnamed protein product [Caenorhabditis auriculariae]
MRGSLFTAVVLALTWLTSAFLLQELPLERYERRDLESFPLGFERNARNGQLFRTLPHYYFRYRSMLGQN